MRLRDKRKENCGIASYDITTYSIANCGITSYDITSFMEPNRI